MERIYIKRKAPRVFESLLLTRCLANTTGLLVYYEFSEFKIAVFVTLDIQLIPCSLSKMNTEEALGIESLVSVHKVDLTSKACCRSVELKNISRCDKLDLIKIFAASLHRSNPFRAVLFRYGSHLTDTRIIYTKSLIVNTFFRLFSTLDACTTSISEAEFDCRLCTKTLRGFCVT